jgi:hypothetical protein
MFPFHEIFYSNKSLYEVSQVDLSKAGLQEQNCYNVFTEN